jgi:hypothetical protein
LSIDSPCIDAGDISAVPSTAALDLAGNPRIVNYTVDMGAYESDFGPKERTYFVDTVTGDDSKDGLSLQNALSTIHRGIEAAKDGDTLRVYPGLYDEEVVFLGKAITIRGVATKDGIPILENPGDFATSFYHGEGPNSILSNFVIRNSFMGVFLAGSSPSIRNITFLNNNSGVEAYSGSEPDIINCIFWHSSELDLFQCVARYSRLDDPDQGEHNITDDPLFVDAINGDYHLRSQRGRYWTEHDIWVLDEVTSPCIDAGDPNSPSMGERQPHGNRINIGAYGGTSKASLTLSDLIAVNQKATRPIPEDGAVGVGRNVILSWVAGEQAVSHDIYVGPTSTETILVSHRQTATGIDLGTLGYSETYYWRIDERDNQDNVTTGDIWMFTTASGEGGQRR